MDMAYANAELERELAAARTFDDVDAALRRLLFEAKNFEAVRGFALFAPGLDAQLVRIANMLKLPPATVGPKGNDNACVIATRMYHAGGHSRLIGDIGRLLGAERTSLLFTDAYDQLRHRQLMATPLNERGFPNRAAVMLSARSLLEKVFELHQILSAIRPTRIFLLTHHMDPVGVIAAWPFRDIVDFVHHGDFQPSLGASLPFSSHVDPTYSCHPFCGAALPGARYVGMTSSNTALAMPERAPTAIRKIATSAVFHKYQGTGPYAWADFAIAAMQGADVEMLHIGDRDEADAVELARRLDAAGIDPARYRYTGFVPNLTQTLIDEQVDAFIGSYPISGGKAYLDVMAAGLAPVVPAPTSTGPLMRFETPLKSWIEITRPDQTAGALRDSLALSAALRAPAARQALAEEFGRFERYLAEG